MSSQRDPLEEVTKRYCAKIVMFWVRAPFVDSALPMLGAGLTDEQLEEAMAYLREHDPEFAEDEALLEAARDHASGTDAGGE
jgi:hypothetical protein